jgi:hypothetical protein
MGTMAQRLALFALLTLAGCGEAVKDDHFAADVKVDGEAAPVVPGAVPVRIGELGASFAACGTAGTTRHLASGELLPVRAAPYDAAAEIGKVPAAAQFFICARSHDQRWMGIVYDESGTLAPACGVASPVTNRRNYEGPCRSGWVSSAFVKLIAG